MIVDQVVMGVRAGNPIAQPTVVDETEWSAFTVTPGDGGPPPPPPPGEFVFPWWLVGIVAVAAVAIRTRSIMKKRAS